MTVRISYPRTMPASPEKRVMTGRISYPRTLPKACSTHVAKSYTRRARPRPKLPPKMPGVAQKWAESCPGSCTPAQTRPNLAMLGNNVAELGQRWSNVEQIWPMWPNCSTQRRPALTRFGRFGFKLSKVPGSLVEHLAQIDQTRSMFEKTAQLGQTVTQNSGPNLQSWPKQDRCSVSNASFRQLWDN